MKRISVIIAVMLLAGCSSMDTNDASAALRAQRNLCEAMRSWEPYRPNECSSENMAARSAAGTM
jgi:uncharacterized protein YceK